MHWEACRIAERNAGELEGWHLRVSSLKRGRVLNVELGPDYSTSSLNHRGGSDVCVAVTMSKSAEGPALPLVEIRLENVTYTVKGSQVSTVSPDLFGCVATNCLITILRPVQLLWG